MHVISRKALVSFASFHPDAETALDVWYRTTKAAQWKSLADVRRVYPHADVVGPYTVFNIEGNKYRLVAEINFRSRIIFIRYVLTHAEYDRGKWKP